MRSLSLRLNLLAAGLVLSILLSLVFNARFAVDQYSSAYQHRIGVQQFEVLLQAQDRISAERAPTLQYISAEDHGDKTVARLNLHHARLQTDRALRQVRSQFMVNDRDPRPLTAIDETLAAIRGRIDRLGENTSAEPGSGVVFSIIVQMINLVDRLRPMISEKTGQLSDGDSSLTATVVNARTASDLRDLGDRLATYLIPAVYGGRALTHAEREGYLKTRGRIDQAIALLSSGNASNPSPDAISAERAEERVRRFFVDEGLALADQLYREGSLGNLYSVTPEELNTRYVASVGSTEWLRKTLVTSMVDAATSARSEAYRLLIISIGLCFLLPVLVVLVIYAIRRSVIKPLFLARRTAVQLARDKFVDMSELRSTTVEVASLFRALSVLNERLAERRDLMEELRLRTETDLLTGLASRAFFESKGEAACCEADGGNGLFGILYFDLDRFKPINDTFGHPAGDAVLSEIGGRLRRFASEKIMIGRMGGDEFAAFCSEMSTSERTALAEAILIEVCRPIRFEDRDLCIGVSIGLSTGEGGAGRFGALCREADTSLYWSKEDGRNRLSLFESQSGRPTPEALREAALQNARSKALLFEPMVDPRTMRHLGWHVLPADLQRSGFFDPFDDALLSDSFRTVAQRDDNSILSLAFHASSVDLAGSLQLTALLGRSGLRPDRLRLEIAEISGHFEDCEHLAALAQLASLGVGLSLRDDCLDDLTEDLPGLQHFRHLTIDARRHGAVQNGTLAALGDGESLSRIVRKFDLHLASRSVEAQTQLCALRALAVESIRGALVGKPARPGDMRIAPARSSSDEEKLLVESAWS